MSKRAERHESKENIWVATDGREYKTRAGAWKHSKKLEEAIQPEIKPEPETELEQPTKDEEVEDDVPIWDTFEFPVEDGEQPTATVPTLLKKIKPNVQTSGKMSKKQRAIMRETNESVVRMGYVTSDFILTKYKRVMLDDPKAEKIEHSDDDYDWITSLTNTALEEQGISIGAAIGSTQYALVANVWWFGSPLYAIHQESDKSPFKGRVLGAFGRFVEKLPFIGRRMRAKRERSSIIQGTVQKDEDA